MLPKTLSGFHHFSDFFKVIETLNSVLFEKEKLFKVFEKACIFLNVSGNGPFVGGAVADSGSGVYAMGIRH